MSTTRATLERSPSSTPDAYPLHLMFERIEAMITRYPRAAMFELEARGHDTLFEQIVSCILSIRTYDETSLPASLALFERARTPAQMNALPEEELLEIIEAVTYAERKASQIKGLAKRIMEDHGGALPEDEEHVRGIHGVGPKCANLALGIATGLPRVSVDVHVHRVVNRWGLVTTGSPTKTLEALDGIIPDELKVDTNRLLMPFGKHVCKRYRPKCGQCPLSQWCERRGVAQGRESGV